MIVLIVAVVFVVQKKGANRAATGMTADQVQRDIFRASDPFANREADAIGVVRQYKVLDPAYVEAVVRARKDGRPAADLSPSFVSIDTLVEQQFLEKRFNMNFLRRGEWRALHLDMDTGETQIPDPQYEVYLDYHDESVTVGPVWIVDLETGVVIPRNDMASVFEQTVYNFDQIVENLKRPGSVVRAIISHKFDVGIDLGGVFLLHFLKLTNRPGHQDDRIIGWTVMHEFQDDFSAYFQWVERDEVRVAKFRFSWKSKSLEPRGLIAIDLMAAGENMSAIKPVDIYPKGYVNNLHIPRTERWPRDHSCRKREHRQICTAFVMVLEQQEFIAAMGWLLTNGEADASHRFEKCNEARLCGWSMDEASGELNPGNREDLFEIRYRYELNDRKQSVSFLVDSEKETITPLDKLSQWAYWSVTPRT